MKTICFHAAKFSLVLLKIAIRGYSVNKCFEVLF